MKGRKLEMALTVLNLVVSVWEDARSQEEIMLQFDTWEQNNGWQSLITGYYFFKDFFCVITAKWGMIKWLEFQILITIFSVISLNV